MTNIVTIDSVNITKLREIIKKKNVADSVC